MSYNGGSYHRQPPRSALPGDPNKIDLSHDDRTLDIPTLLNQPSFEQKASELPSTRTVQAPVRAG